MNTRAVVALMMFSATFMTYTIRVNMSINLLAMVQPSSKHNESIPECIRQGAVNATFKKQPILDYGPRYEWSSTVQGNILGSYFWGAIVTCIPGGLLAEKFGPTRVVMISTLIGGVFTLLGPLLASWHYYAIISSRVLIGLCGGVIYPCMHCLVSRWAPPEEKGKFISALMGGNFGTVATWPLLGAIIEQWGWRWSFYLNGMLVVIWCVVWMWLVSDSPENHPRISKEEQLFISTSLGNVSGKISGLPPYGKILLSVPFWGFVILHFGNLWGMFFLMTGGPKYMSTVLGFDLGRTGFLSALPYLARLIFGFFFGWIGDVIRKRHYLSTTSVRKGFTFFSHVVPGLLLLALIWTGCDISWSVALLTLSLGSNGASTLTNLQNSQDLAPNFAGSLYGLANFIGSTTGFLTPLIVSAITKENNGLVEWHTIFIIGAAVYILTGLTFGIFGSAEVQKWNTVEQKKVGVENPGFEAEINKVPVQCESTTI